ncbi:pleckstrin (PH) domain-containing protein [Tieghemostelium lacteum]|uniref:Pleckstrin (PH) domain-containing protein n=1 Tax=Tieghemostelium lacteum TaxID=361077 RepID=A0A151Z724_TIELA|nr:pleckstrin (PH) domain-containing protein [Tieghemostelium lacteum]|eukprot:KYQ89762.1 pleckstrin (PH) domain-containing protein [Tieghemostelium lacteum]
MARTKNCRRKPYSYLPTTLQDYSQYYNKYLNHLKGIEYLLYDKLNHKLISNDYLFFSDILLNFDKFDNKTKSTIFEKLSNHQLSKYIKDIILNNKLDLVPSSLYYIVENYNQSFFNPLFRLLEKENILWRNKNNIGHTSIFKIKDFLLNFFQKVYQSIKSLVTFDHLEITSTSFKVCLYSYYEFPDLLYILMTFFSKMPEDLQKESIQPIFKSLLDASNNYINTIEPREYLTECSQSLKLFSSHIGIDNAVKFLIDSLNEKENEYYMSIDFLFHHFEAFDFIQSNFSSIIMKLFNLAIDFDNKVRSLKSISLLNEITKKFNKIEYGEEQLSLILANIHKCKFSLELIDYLCVIVKRYPMSFEQNFHSYWSEIKGDFIHWTKFLDTLMVSLGETFQTKYLDKYNVHLTPTQFWKSYKKYILDLYTDKSRLMSIDVHEIKSFKFLWQLYLDIDNLTDIDLDERQEMLTEISSLMFGKLDYIDSFKFTKMINQHLNGKGLPKFQLLIDKYIDDCDKTSYFLTQNAKILVSNLIVCDKLKYGLPYVEKILDIEKYSEITKYQYTSALQILLISKQSQLDIDHLILPWLKQYQLRPSKKRNGIFHQILLSTPNPNSIFGEYIQFLLKSMDPKSVYRLVIDLVEKPNVFTLNLSHEIFSVKIQPKLFYQLVRLVAPIQLKPTEIDLIRFDFILRNILNYSIELNLGKRSKINIISNLAMVSKRFFKMIGNIICHNEKFEFRYQCDIMTTHSIIQPDSVPAHMNQYDLIYIPPHLIESSIYEHLKSLKLNLPINITGNRPLKSLLRLKLSKNFPVQLVSIFVNILKNSPSIQEVKIDISPESKFLTNDLIEYLIKETQHLKILTLITSKYNSTTPESNLIANFIKEMEIKEIMCPKFKFVHKIIYLIGDVYVVMSKKSKNNIVISSPSNFRVVTNSENEESVDKTRESTESAVTALDSSNYDNQSEFNDYNNNIYDSQDQDMESPPIQQLNNKPVIPASSTKPKISLNSYLQEQHRKAINEKVYFKVTPKLLEEVKEWEDKKNEYSKSIDHLLENKSKQLQMIFNEYLQEMKPILDTFNFDDSLKRDILNREKSRLDSVQQKLFGSKNASLSALEEQISSRKLEINMHNKITLIQSHVRGWLQRLRYREMMRHIALRNKCANEIMETERNYVQNLGILIDQFLVPLQTTKKDLLSSAEITSVFSNCSLIHGVHKELLDSLEKKYAKWSNEQSLAVCFLDLTPFLKLYTQYINNFNHATITLNECKKRDPKVKEFFGNKDKSKDLGSRDFLDLQIQPVQRIPRYKLLLTELLQHTPSIHKDYENIKLALKEIQNLAISINESKRDAEGFEKTILIQSSLTRNIELIQPSRKHIKDGIIQFEKRGQLKERYLFLFNDALLLCKKVQNIFDSSPRYSPVSFMKLAGAITLLAEDPEFKNGFAVLGNEHLYFYTKSPVEQLEWFLVIKEVIKDLEQSDSTLKKDEVKEQPMVREVSSKHASVADIKQLTNSNSNNNLGPTLSNPRNSVKLEQKQSVSQINQPLVIERNSKLYDHSNVSGSGGLHFSPQSSSSTPSGNSMFPPLNPLSLSNSSSGSNTSSPSSSSTNIMPPVYNNYQPIQPPQPTAVNLTIRELINIYNEINTLQTQLLQPSNQLEVIFGSYIKNINQQELNSNLQKINDLLSKIINLKNRSVTLLKEDEISNSLQNVITQGKDNIGSFNLWLKQAFPLGNADPNSQQPRTLIINLMKWYNNLHKIWLEVLDYKK